MERIIKQLVSKKLRKKGKDYNLTPDSKLSGQDFGYANKIASQIYSFCKAVFPETSEREVYQRLLSTTIALVRTDEVHELGQLRIGYGNTSSLKGFQLNQRQSWSGYVPWNTEIVCSPKVRRIEITIPETKKWLLRNYDDRVSKLAVSYHAFRIPFHLDEEPATQSTKVLFIQPNQEYKEKKTGFDIREWDNCLIIVLGTVRSYLWEKQGADVFLSTNRSLMGAEFLEVFRSRDGELIHDRLKEKPQSMQGEEEEGVDWE